MLFPKNKTDRLFFYLFTGVMGLFLLLWFVCARSFTGWGDEMAHMATAKGLVETGDYRTWALDEGRATPATYTRGLVITNLASLIYKMAGLSLLAFRLIPLISVLLTFLTFAVYIRARHKASWEALAFAAIFFFSQTYIFEQSVYLRLYAPLGWLMVLSLILYWEAVVAFQKRRAVAGCGLLSLSIIVLALPTIDHWQVQHIAIYALGVVLTLPPVAGVIAGIDQKTSARTKVILGILVLVCSPFFVLLLDQIMGHLVVDAKGRVMGRHFVTYWDNVAGLVRYVLALNVCVLGFSWLRRDLIKARLFDFNSWLFFSGIVSGILIGLLNPHNHIFFSRFFYVSIVMAVLGFSQILLQPGFPRKAVRKIVAVYLLFNAGLFAVNAYYERSNIREPISWLKSNLGADDLLLVYGSELELHGGEELLTRAYAVIPNQDPAGIKQFIARIEKSGAGNIYFLYADHYEFRDRLYLWTTGLDRTPPTDLFRYLKEAVPSRAVMPGLRTCDLVIFKKADLVASLQKLLQEGYPPHFKAPEKRILKKILTRPAS